VRRRDFLWTAAAAAARSATPARLAVPVYRILDARAQCPAELVRHFRSALWPEAVRDFSRGGIDLEASEGPGEIRHSAADRPIFVGLRRGAINLLVTDHLPLYWDNSRALAGATTLYDGYHLCMIALRYAHGDQAAFLSVNTCVHELLHALMQDIYVSRPRWYQSGGREFRVDWYATRLWLFHDGAAVRESAQSYLNRLRAAAPR
jgi:hypothetical protein